MVYDPKADRILLYGGANFAEGVACGFCGATTVLGDLWAYDYESNTWTERHPSLSPPPHHFPVLEYVPTIDRVFCSVGFNRASYPVQRYVGLRLQCQSVDEPHSEEPASSACVSLHGA